MSMQTYDFTCPANQAKEISAQGRYLYYYQGTTPFIDAATVSASAGNQGIKVTAGAGGSSLVLMPGQFVRLSDSDKSPGYWRVANNKNLEQITGQVIIGDGEFGDANILNTVRLDGSVINPMKVINTTADRIPVKLDPADLLLMGPIVNYTNAFLNTGALAASAVVTIVAPGANTNGIILSKIVMPSDVNAHAIIAKATTPVNIQDGDILYSQAGGAPALDNTVAIKIPAGRGLYLVANASGLTAAYRNFLYAIL